MRQDIIPNKTVLLLDVGGDLADPLRRELEALGLKVVSRARRAAADFPEADAIFCPDDPSLYLAVLRDWRVEAGIPVIVAGRNPIAERWLAALDAGAADYCAAPFEAAVLGWILESSFSRRPRPVAKAMGAALLRASA